MVLLELPRVLLIDRFCNFSRYCCLYRHNNLSTSGSHATCHAETSTADSLASRLRHEAAAAEHSRSGTPEVAGIRSTPARTIAVSSLKAEVKRSMSPDTRLTGTKRKVEDVDNTQAEGDETPPSKRVAISIDS